MTTHYRIILGVAAATFLAACGCDTVGYPAIDATVEDRITARPVALGGATLRYGNEIQSEVERIVPASDTSNRVWLCCTPGTWRARSTRWGSVTG